MNAPEVIGKLLADQPGGDPGEIAALVLAQCTKLQLMPLIYEEVLHRQRHLQRHAESMAFSQLLERFTTASQSMPSATEMASLDNFRALYKSPIRLGNGVGTTWGRATLAEHQQRAEMLRRLRGGLDRTIERHEEAIRILQATGASCLEQLEAAA